MSFLGFVLLSSLAALAIAQSQPRGSDWPMVDRITVGLSAAPLTGYPMQNAGAYAPGGPFFTVDVASTSFSMPTRLLTITVRGPNLAPGSFSPWRWTASDWTSETTALLAQTAPAGGLVGGVPVFVINTLTAYGCLAGCDTGTWSSVTTNVGDSNADYYLSEMPTIGAAIANDFDYAWIVVEPEWNKAAALRSPTATAVLEQAITRLKTAVSSKPGIKVGVGYQLDSNVTLNRNNWVSYTTGTINFDATIAAADFVGLTPRPYTNTTKDIMALQYGTGGGFRIPCTRFQTDCGQANVALYAAVVDLWDEFQKPSMTPYLTVSPSSFVPNITEQDQFDVAVCDYASVWAQIPGSLMLRGFFAHGHTQLMSATDSFSPVGLVSVEVTAGQIDPSKMFLKFAAGPPLPAPQGIAYRAFLEGQEAGEASPVDPDFTSITAGSRVFAAYQHSYTIYSNSYINFAWTIKVGGACIVNRLNGITGQVNQCPIDNNPCMLAQFPASPTASDKIDFQYAPDATGVSPADLVPSKFGYLNFSFSLNSASPPDCSFQWTLPTTSASALLSDYVVGTWVDGSSNDAWNLVSVPMSVWSTMTSLQQLTLSCATGYIGTSIQGIRFNKLTLVPVVTSPSVSPTPSVSASPSTGASGSASPSPAAGVSLTSTPTRPAASASPTKPVAASPSVTPAAAGAGTVTITLTPPSGGSVSSSDSQITTMINSLFSGSGLSSAGPIVIVRNSDGSVTVTTYVAGGNKDADSFASYVSSNSAVLAPSCTPSDCTVAAAASGGGGGGGGSNSDTGVFGLPFVIGWVVVGIIALCGACCLLVCCVVVVVLIVAAFIGFGALLKGRGGGGGHAIKNLSMAPGGGDAWSQQHSGSMF